MSRIFTLQNPKVILQTCVCACNQSTIIKKKRKGKIRNGALPLGMAVCPGLCWSSVTLSSTARQGEGGEGKKRGGKKRLTAKNKSDTLKFPSFLLFTIKIFSFFCLETPGFQRRFEQLNLWFGNPHKPFICMSSGNKANNHPRK